MNDLKLRTKPSGSDVQLFDAVVIGAGFAGLYALYRLREMGLAVRLYEGAGGVGGTWWWNRYPGARVDFPSAPYYSYSFSEELLNEFEWKERQPSQAEVLSYLDFVADKLKLRTHIQLETWIQDAVFDEIAQRWNIETHLGEHISTQFLISAMGTLSEANKPNIPGIDDFAGEIIHTGRWPAEEVKFAGKRVGVIGTGSSGIQSIPMIARQAEHLTVFQRTPQYSIPAGNRPVKPEEIADARANFDKRREFMKVSPLGMPYPMSERSALDDSPEVRNALYETLWQDGGLHMLFNSYNDLLTNKAANDTLCEFIREKIRSIVKDPETVKKLLPDYILATKRQAIDDGYFETYNEDHVDLVDLRDDPIVKITADGITTKNGEHPLDMLVLATGYDAITGKLLRLNPKGRGGLDLATAWDKRFFTYLGVAIPGFPNLFMVHGPQSPSVLYNMPYGGEMEGDWIRDCIAYLRDNNIATIEPAPGVDEPWAENVEEAAKQTLFHGTDSWYSGANIEGKHRQFIVHLGGPEYFKHLTDVAEKNYEGFVLGKESATLASAKA
ncbi:MAG: NAD(P)/FAD-dependent oxidoreductase [Proteobacteria bacterium]|nr:NAD(P)/FAD-dependent oxidoreductase [Pseudomonadota bacterium]